jgi:hypothetical protein
MKKAVSFIISAAMVCGTAQQFAAPVWAGESSTYVEYHDEVRAETENEFPDPYARYTQVTEGSLVFNVYDEFALLEECTDTDAEEVTIPDTVEGVPVVGIIGKPFGFCHKLTAIHIPDGFTHFSWFNLICTVLVPLGSEEEPMPTVLAVTVSDTNPDFTVKDGLLYSKDMKTLIGCPPAIDMKELTISEETETIGDYAFVECMSLEKAVIPETVKHINRNAFTGCFGLESAELPSTITKLSGDMFYSCTSLKEVKFNGEISVIGMGVFNECTSLTEFEIPDTVTTIGSAAFEGSGCIENVDGIHYVGNWAVGSDSDIEKAEIREGTIGIAEMSFMVRKDMKSLDIPWSVIYVGDICFTGLSSGERAEIHNRSPYINELTFAVSKNSTDIYIYDPQCVIFDSEKTIPAEFKYLAPENAGEYPGDVDLVEEKYLAGQVAIHGYEGSTAQEYAEKYGRRFIPIELLPGDANCDDKFNISDVVIFQKWLLGSSDQRIPVWQNADVCADGVLDAFDLGLMKKKLISAE